MFEKKVTSGSGRFEEVLFKVCTDVGVGIFDLGIASLRALKFRSTAQFSSSLDEREVFETVVVASASETEGLYMKFPERLLNNKMEISSGNASLIFFVSE